MMILVAYLKPLGGEEEKRAACNAFVERAIKSGKCHLLWILDLEQVLMG